MNELIAQIMDNGAQSVMVREFDPGDMRYVAVTMKDGTRHGVHCETFDEGLLKIVEWQAMRQYHKVA